MSVRSRGTLVLLDMDTVHVDNVCILLDIWVQLYLLWTLTQMWTS